MAMIEGTNYSWVSTFHIFFIYLGPGYDPDLIFFNSMLGFRTYNRIREKVCNVL